MSLAIAEKKVPLKKAIYFTLVLTLISCLSTGALVYALSPNSFITIAPGVQSGAPDYTIFIDDGVCYAKNAYGAISFNSANADTVIKAAVDALALTGGTVYIKQGIYSNLEGPYILNTNVSVYGDYLGTQLIQGNYDEKLFLITGSNVQIHDLSMYSTQTGGTSQRAIWVYSTGGIFLNRIQIYHNVIANFQQDGILVKGDPGTVQGEIDIHDNTIYYMTQNAILMDTTAYVWNIHNNILHDNNFGVSVVACGEGNIYANNIYSNANRGIHVYGGYATNIVSNEINNNNYDGILWDTTPDAKGSVIANNKIMGNDRLSYGSAGIKIDNASYILVQGNNAAIDSGFQYYGIIESNSANFNAFTGNYLRATYPITVVGANSTDTANFKLTS